MRTFTPGHRLAVIAAALLVSGCLESTGPSRDEVAQVLIVAPIRTVQVGETLQLEGRAVTYGAERVDHLVTWASSDTRFLTVSNTGLVTGVAVGGADVIATADGKSHSVRMTVFDVEE
jgi:hypothetical protein